MEQGEGGKDLLATTLQEKLTNFASSKTADREKALPELVAFIKDGIDKEVMEKLVDKEFQLRLEDVVKTTLGVRFERPDGTLADVWQGGYTTVVLDENGRVKGAASVPTEGLEEYGDLNKYALIKAACELHLHKMDKIRGLSDVENFRYLEGLGLKRGDDLFTGSHYFIDKGGKKVLVGSSGCAPKKDYLKELLAGAEPTADTQAGLFDREFSRLVANYLQNEGSQEFQAFKEPPAIQQVRINN